MIQTAHCQVYVGDFVLIQIHQESCLELFCGKILRFYMKVHVTVHFTPHTIPIIHNVYNWYSVWRLLLGIVYRDFYLCLM